MITNGGGLSVESMEETEEVPFDRLTRPNSNANLMIGITLYSSILIYNIAYEGRLDHGG